MSTHKLLGGYFYHARPECQSCTELKLDSSQKSPWVGYCAARQKTLCCEKLRRSPCKLYRKKSGERKSDATILGKVGTAHRRL